MVNNVPKLGKIMTNEKGRSGSFLTGIVHVFNCVQIVDRESHEHWDKWSKVLQGVSHLNEPLLADGCRVIESESVKVINATDLS